VGAQRSSGGPKRVEGRQKLGRASCRVFNPRGGRVAEVMSSEIKYCFDDQDVNDVLRNMSDIQVRRLPVVNREKRVEAGIATGSGRKTSDSVPVQKRHWMQYGL
jgi:CBS-domain-containing membrane protein